MEYMTASVHDGMIPMPSISVAHCANHQPREVLNMMRTSKLLLGAMFGLCFVPSAYAQSLSPVNTAFTLAGGISVVAGAASLNCTISLVGATNSAGAATITAASVTGAGLCVTLVPTGFPWPVTATAADMVTLSGLQLRTPFGVAGPTTATGVYDNNLGILTFTNAASTTGSLISATLDSTPSLRIVP
ncbi:MAG: hypothetical protein ACREO8_00565 [Luteimonas sp.]